jgi:bifunctional ADP-heptose synthase (sugar kinase/adenylyltransferase)
MKVLVLGDGIVDFYEYYTATRLCPEGPVPVLVSVEPRKRCSGGGAELVAQQLMELMSSDGNDLIQCSLGSGSNKTRIFADDRLMLRIDEDSIWTISEDEYKQAIQNLLAETKYDAVIVSDYAKGAFTYPLGQWLVQKTNELGIPLFVDAKQNWFYYGGCFAMFPNKSEAKQDYQFVTQHVIQKLGADGCEVDGEKIPQRRPHAVRDVTGAGDIFLAAFVYHWLTYADKSLTLAARFANRVAGISVEYIGTHIVSHQELLGS